MTPIIVAMRAPLLSATSSLDRICTIRSTIYSRMILELFLDDFHQSPALSFAQRSSFHDADRVAGLCLILLVMRIKLFHLVDDFPELRMWHARDRLYYNRFVHSARNHFAGAGLPRTAGHGRRERRRLSNRSLILFGHKIYFFVSVTRSESTVSIRATSRRSKRSRLGCSS